ncbi:MAG: limonene-1,2-epoxide hydrolase family protein [Nocardioides marinisabuli]|uniref:limonene-1,2-epoxide hydrolase family protein n=1 Tax=Nocardioides marinisabuli TaxID=419476 RepID=UPI00321B6E2E
MSEPRDVVRAFLTHLSDGETEQATALLAPDVVWRNTRLPTVRGEKVAEALRMLGERGVGVRVELHHVGADGSTVLTDRHDTLTWKAYGSRFHVDGTFEVRDGLITLWDDRFSWGEASVASVVGLLRLLRAS